jgi:F-type H+-transporting ATPase subunit gamma
MSGNGLRRTAALLKHLRSNNGKGPVRSDLFAPYGSRFVSLQIVAQRMKSVGNIQKITAAMKMVAASRLKGAQTKMEKSRGLVEPMFRMLGDQPGIDAEKTMVVPISSDKGLCGGINSTVVKYSKVVSGVAEGNQTSMTIIGEKARGQLSKAYADSLKNVIVDLSKVPLTFAAASLVTDAILAEGAQKHQIIYNRFQSVISFKPTVATVYSSDEYEKAAENGSIKFDEYEMEGPERSEFLLDLAEFNMGAVMYNALLENSTSELGSRMQSMENSTKNAKDMLGKLTLLYNRTRQASITTELIEIISGASALEG